MPAAGGSGSRLVQISALLTVMVPIESAVSVVVDVAMLVVVVVRAVRGKVP